MLSPGQWHKMVPKDLRENLTFRKELLKRARVDQRLQRGLIEMCRLDILFAINVFTWQFNPNHIGQEVGPFITWPAQDRIILETINWLYTTRERRDMLWEKSREMGASWMSLIIHDWMCRFHSWKKCLAISHTEEAVDSPNNPDSLFWKVKFMNEHMPDWLKRRMTKTKMAFAYPETRSYFNGTATTERAGVGGRGYVLLDEFSKHKDDFAILGQTADTGPRLFIGTHYGLGTAFYQLSQRVDLKKIIIHWTQHPEKNKGMYSYEDNKQKFWRYEEEADEIVETACNYDYPVEFKFVMDGSPLGGPHPGIRSPWYDHEVTRRANARDVAMHLDINPTGSVSQAFDPLLIRRLIQRYARDPDWEGDVVYDDRGRLIELTPRKGGSLRLWCKLGEDGKPDVAFYGAGADVSSGRGATPSCLSIFNGHTGLKVAEYFDANIDPRDFGTLACALGGLFADRYGSGAKLIWEHHGPGTSFGAQVIELNYNNIAVTRSEDKTGRPRVSTYGFNPVGVGITRLLGSYAHALAKGIIENPSERALEQCLAFKYDQRGRPVHSSVAVKDKPEGAGENHGDLVVSDALGYKMIKEEGLLRSSLDEQNARKARTKSQSVPGSFDWRMELAEMEEDADLVDSMEGL